MNDPTSTVEYPLGPPLEFLERVWALNHFLERVSARMDRVLGVPFTDSTRRPVRSSSTRTTASAPSGAAASTAPVAFSSWRSCATNGDSWSLVDTYTVFTSDGSSIAPRSWKPQPAAAARTSRTA